MKLLGKIKHHHLLMMVVCCIVPFVALLGATYYLGLDRKYLFWATLVLCPAMHIFMMKGMHGDKKSKKKNGDCH